MFRQNTIIKNQNQINSSKHFFNTKSTVATDVREKKEHLNSKKKTHQKAIIESLC